MDWHMIRLCLAPLALSYLFSNADAAFRGNEKWIWPNGNVYYRLSSIIKSDSSKSSMITEAMADITKAAPCVNFIDIEEARLNVTTFVDIVTHGDVTLQVSGSGCNSEVGYQGRRQILNLQPSHCFKTAIIKHNLFHTLGCVHEHARPDAAQNLDFFMKNVSPGLRHNFKVEKDDYEDFDKGVYDFNTPFDIFSIMQYPSFAFALNDSLKTMQSKDPYFHDTFGFGEDFSEIDVVELNLRYRCSLTPELVLDYVNSYMGIMGSRSRMDMAKLEKQHQIDQERVNNLENLSVIHQNIIGNLTQQHQTDQDRVNQLEYQSLIDKKRMTKLEGQIQVDQEKQEVYQKRITNLEVQVQVDQGQRKVDQERISNLETLIEKIITSAPV